MCPACLTTAALIAVGSTSAGGIGAAILGKLFRRRRRGEPSKPIGHTPPESKSH
jgi:hypothetical protein